MTTGLTGSKIENTIKNLELGIFPIVNSRDTDLDYAITISLQKMEALLC